MTFQAGRFRCCLLALLSMNFLPEVLAAMPSSLLKIATKSPRLVLGLTSLSFLFATALQAQLPVSRLYTVFPPGGRAGSTVEVAVTGADVDDARLLHFSTTNISAVAKTNAAGALDPSHFVLNIASNTPPGIYEI